MIFKSQKDPRWSSYKIGNSKYTIRQYGCLISCFAMILEVDPPNIARHSEYFNSEAVFIQQPKCAKDFGGEYVPKRDIAIFDPVICRVNFAGQQHFIVRYKGKFYDPLSLIGKPLRDYKILSYRNLKLKGDTLKKEHFGKTLKFKGGKNIWIHLKDFDIWQKIFGGKINTTLIHPSNLKKQLNKQYEKQIANIESRHNKDVLKLRETIELKNVEIKKLDILYEQCQNNIKIKKEKPIPTLPTKSWWLKVWEWLNKERT